MLLFGIYFSWLILPVKNIDKIEMKLVLISFKYLLAHYWLAKNSKQFVFNSLLWSPIAYDQVCDATGNAAKVDKTNNSYETINGSL